METPRTHSIGYLLKLIEDSGKVCIPAELKEAAVLTDYSVETRYPGDWEPVGEEEYKQAVFLANSICSWVLSIVR